MYLKQIDEVLRNKGSLENTPHKLIYHSLLDPDANKGRALPSRLSLKQEAGAVINAGSDSTSISATTITYHVLHNPEVQQRLIKELRVAWPVLEEVPRYEVLEKLPYLASPYKPSFVQFESSTAFCRLRLSKRGSACFQEALRYHVSSPQKVR